MSQRHDNRTHATQKTVRGSRRRGNAIHPCLPAYLGIEQRTDGRTRRE
jgi:hypothetical protein